MKLRLDKKKQGTYEKTNGLRYFGNEKFRKENYFGKQKLQVRNREVAVLKAIYNNWPFIRFHSQVNVARMTLKMRRAEIEERMDSGMSYEAAGKSMLDSSRICCRSPLSQTVKEVDSLLKTNSANAVEEAEQDSAMTASLRQLFTAVDRDRCPMPARCALLGRLTFRLQVGDHQQRRDGDGISADAGELGRPQDRPAGALRTNRPRASMRRRAQ